MEKVSLVILVDPQAWEVVMAGELNDYAVFVLLNNFKVFLIWLIVPHLKGSVARASIDVASDDEFTLTILAELLLEPLMLFLTAIA